MTNRWLSAVPAQSKLDRVSPDSEQRPRASDAQNAAMPSAPRPAVAPELTLEDFRRYFSRSPTALAIKECARLSVIRRYACPSPILDVGCGDGLFAQMAFDDAEVWGIDIDAAEGRWAAASKAYSQIILGDVTRASLPESFFATCVANCSLEHVPRIDLALRNIHDSLRPGGIAYLFVPTADWASHLLSARMLTKFIGPAWGKKIERAIDTQFRHHHLYDADGWRRLVVESGMEVVEIEPVLSTATTVAFEAFLLPSLAGLLNKKLTTRWTNFPPVRELLAKPVYRAVKSIMDHSDQTATAEYLVVARRPEAQ